MQLKVTQTNCKTHLECPTEQCCKLPKGLWDKVFKCMECYHNHSHPVPPLSSFTSLQTWIIHENEIFEGLSNVCYFKSCVFKVHFWHDPCVKTWMNPVI